MTVKKNPLVFLDVSIDGHPAEKIVIEVFPNLEIIFLLSLLIH